jgi:hypothetical protein
MAELPAALIAYLQQRDAARADAVTTFLASLTDRERALIRDAAVMGYVRGRMHPKDEPHPKDSHVLAEVVAACLDITDMYPAISTEEAEGPRTVCVCGHTRGEHVEVSGRLLCDECDPDSTENLVCREFEAL